MLWTAGAWGAGGNANYPGEDSDSDYSEIERERERESEGRETFREEGSIAPFHTATCRVVVTKRFTQYWDYPTPLSPSAVCPRLLDRCRSDNSLEMETEGRTKSEAAAAFFSPTSPLGRFLPLLSPSAPHSSIQPSSAAAPMLRVRSPNLKRS